MLYWVRRRSYQVDNVEAACTDKDSLLVVETGWSTGEHEEGEPITSRVAGISLALHTASHPRAPACATF